MGRDELGAVEAQLDEVCAAAAAQSHSPAAWLASAARPRLHAVSARQRRSPIRSPDDRDPWAQPHAQPPPHPPQHPRDPTHNPPPPPPHTHPRLPPGFQNIAKGLVSAPFVVPVCGGCVRCTQLQSCLKRNQRVSPRACPMQQRSSPLLPRRRISRPRSRFNTWWHFTADPPRHRQRSGMQKSTAQPCSCRRTCVFESLDVWDVRRLSLTCHAWASAVRDCRLPRLSSSLRIRNAGALIGALPWGSLRWRPARHDTLPHQPHHAGGKICSCAQW
jgi:hypothetical protein